LGYPNGGRMNWAAANAWAATLNIHDVTGWRLPTLTPVNGHTFNMCYREDGSTDAGYALTTTDGTDGGWRDASGNPVSEMGHMYYVTLGNQAHSRSNTGPFYNFGHLYWTDKIVNASLGYGAIFNPQLGNQGYYWLTSPLHFWVVRDGDLVTKVLIDIKPGSEPNSINPRSKGKIPVAIISTMDFDASVEVDTGSLTFGPNGNEQSFAFCNESPEDVNDDGYDDLVCHFYTQEAGFECGDEEGYLRGELVDGTPIEGSDSVRIVPCR